MDYASAWQVPASGASLYGKLPTVLDYVRVNHSYAGAIALDEWLQRCIQDLTLANVSWTGQRMRFLFAPTQLDHALVGTIVGSRDRAGRKFPLAIFTALPCAAARTFTLLPTACEAFFTQVDALLDDTKTLQREELADKLDALTVPTAADFKAARASVEQSMSSLDAASFAQSLFGDDSAQQAARAYAATLSAAYATRAEPAERPTALDCPVTSTADVTAWLTLVAKLLRWPCAAPSLFWTTDGEPGRLLISLGTPPASLSVWLADRKRKSDKLVTLPPQRLSAHADQLVDKLVTAQPSSGESVAGYFAQLASLAAEH